MKNKKVGIIDYGAGNIENVVRAIAALGSDYKVITESQDFNYCQSLILPGVGAFPFGMKNILDKGISEGLRQAHDLTKPILGICLGMQLLFEESNEFVHTKGLSLLNGTVQELPSTVPTMKVPRFGWFPVVSSGESCWSRLHLRSGSYFYFAHSFYAKPIGRIPTLSSPHGNLKLCVGVFQNNLIGVQFHPEKSGTVGLAFLRGFLGIE